ncbi:hypothetical protein BJX70DRAFT_400465 [Aspergillus crustosus]
MCFYNQKKFACGDFSWSTFAYQCDHEYRTGETCGIRLANATNYETALCRICEKIAIKQRRRKQEVDRLTRWKREGGKLTASMAEAEEAIKKLDLEIETLLKQRRDKKNALEC